MHVCVGSSQLVWEVCFITTQTAATGISQLETRLSLSAYAHLGCWNSTNPWSIGTMWIFWGVKNLSKYAMCCTIIAYNSMCIYIYYIYILNSTVYHISCCFCIYSSETARKQQPFKTSNTRGMYTPEMPGFTPRNRETCILHHTGQSKRGKPEQLTWFSQVGP